MEWLRAQPREPDRFGNVIAREVEDAARAQLGDELAEVFDRVAGRLLQPEPAPIPAELVPPELPDLTAPFPMIRVIAAPVSRAFLWAPDPREPRPQYREAGAWSNMTVGAWPAPIAPAPGVTEETLAAVGARFAELFDRAVFAQPTRYERATRTGGICSAWPPPEEVTAEDAARAKEYRQAVELTNEYRAWRQVPRVDPAAGPEAHALDPTPAQAVQFHRWWWLLYEREDVGGFADPYAGGWPD